MAAVNEIDTSKLNGYFKEQYGEDVEKLQPESAIAARDIPFKQRGKLGESYSIPVRVRRAMGWTFDSSGEAFSINTPVAGATRKAEFTPTSFLLEERIALAVLSRAQDNKAAFGDAMDDTVEDLNASGALAREVSLLYGGDNIGEVEDSTQDSSGVYSVVISKASWAAGLWSQAEGMMVDIYNAAGGTQRNSSNDAQVTYVDPDTRTLTIEGDDTELGNVVATDQIFPKGFKDDSFTGLSTICSNTGTLFGVDGGTYGQWRGNTIAVGSVKLGLGKILRGAATSTVRGGMGTLCAYVSAYSWEDMNNDHAGLRRLADEAKNEVVLGTQKITYYGTNGKLEIKCHPMLKAGEALVFPPDKMERRGSSDLTFKVPGSNEKFFYHLPNNAGVGLRVWWDQGLFPRNLARCVKFTGIVNDSLA